MEYKEFKIGDKVICSIKGKGIVHYISFYDSDGDYNKNPICVKFENEKCGYYTVNGELERDYNRTLFIYERKYNKTKEEVKAKYKELLSKIEILSYQELESNWFVDIIDDRNSYSFKTKFLRYVDDFSTIYMSKTDAEFIVDELNKFIGYKW